MKRNHGTGGRKVERVAAPWGVSPPSCGSVRPSAALPPSRRSPSAPRGAGALGVGNMGSWEERFWGWWDRFSEWEPWGGHEEERKPLIQTRASKAREEDPVLATIPREGWYGFRMFLLGCMITFLVFMLPVMVIAVEDSQSHDPEVTYSRDTGDVKNV